MIYFLRHAEHKQNDKQTEIKGTAGKRARLSVGYSGPAIRYILNGLASEKRGLFRVVSRHCVIP